MRNEIFTPTRANNSPLSRQRQTYSVGSWLHPLAISTVLFFLVDDMRSRTAFIINKYPTGPARQFQRCREFL